MIFKKRPPKGREAIRFANFRNKKNIYVNILIENVKIKKSMDS
jgi:hypothetical protein